MDPESKSAVQASNAQRRGGLIHGGDRHMVGRIQRSGNRGAVLPRWLALPGPAIHSLGNGGGNPRYDRRDVRRHVDY